MDKKWSLCACVVYDVISSGVNTWTLFYSDILFYNAFFITDTCIFFFYRNKR